MFGDSLGGSDQVELRDAFGGCNLVGWKVHFKAKLVQPRDEFGGGD
jgi:hypothetical protein